MTEQYHGGAAAQDAILHALQAMQGQLHRIETRLESLVPRPEYEAWKSAAAADHARIEAAVRRNTDAIEQVDQRVQAAERVRNAWARDVNLKVWLAILGAGLSLAVGIIVRAF
jgi:hypothetical protein